MLCLHTLRLTKATLLAGAKFRFSMVQVIDLRRGRIPYIIIWKLQLRKSVKDVLFQQEKKVLIILNVYQIYIYISLIILKCSMVEPHTSAGVQETINRK